MGGGDTLGKCTSEKEPIMGDKEPYNMEMCKLTMEIVCNFI